MSAEFKYGLITGAGICGWTLLEYCLGLHTTHLAAGQYTGFLSLIIPLTTLWLLLRHRRDTAPGGRLGFWSGVLSGLSASFISGTMVYLFMQVYNLFINPGWMDSVLDWQVARFRADGLTEVAIREKIKFYRQMQSPLGCVLSLVGGPTLTGGVIAAGFTLLLRHPRNPAVRPGADVNE